MDTSFLRSREQREARPIQSAARLRQNARLISQDESTKDQLEKTNNKHPPSICKLIQSKVAIMNNQLSSSSSNDDKNERVQAWPFGASTSCDVVKFRDPKRRMNPTYKLRGREDAPTRLVTFREEKIFCPR